MGIFSRLGVVIVHVRLETRGRGKDLRERERYPYLFTKCEHELASDYEGVEALGCELPIRWRENGVRL